MNYTDLRSEVSKLTGQKQKWVGDKQPMSYTPSRKHWRSPDSYIEKFLHVNHVTKRRGK